MRPPNRFETWRFGPLHIDRIDDADRYYTTIGLATGPVRVRLSISLDRTPVPRLGGDEGA